MKIVINCLPRSGSKLLHCNFQSYLKAISSKILAPDSIDSIKEPLTFDDAEIKQERALKSFSVQGNQLKYFPRLSGGCALEEELRIRARNLFATKYGWVLKRTPYVEFDPILYDTIINSNKSIAVIRKNVFDQALSFMIAKSFNAWTVGTELDNAIQQGSANKIIIDETQFVETYKWMTSFNRIKWVSEVQVVDFDSMVEIKNSADFCSFFKLPPCEFEFHNFDVEYGNHKFNMVDNLNKLKFLVNDIERSI